MEVQDAMNTSKGSNETRLSFLNSNRTILKRTAKQLAEIRERIILAAEDSSSIGTVCASSGGRSALRNHHLDWALVSLDDDAISRVKVDGVNTITPHVLMPRPYGQIRLSPNESEQPQLLRPGATVYNAQYPGYTSGTINATKSYVRLRQGNNNNDSDDTVVEAVEWAVVPDRSYKAFGDPGDCGAWVVHRVSNVLAGVLFATNSAMGIAYVMPITEILEDITRVTGYTVQLPVS